MNIKVYKNTSPKFFVNKVLTNETTISGYLRSGCSIENPEINFELVTLPDFNYAYIEDFNRYYFVTKKFNINVKLWTVTFHVDVLKTFWNDIKECDCIVNRNQYKRINDLIDNEIWVTSDSLYSTYLFPYNPFSTTYTNPKRYVILLAGAGVAESVVNVDYTVGSGANCRDPYWYDNGIYLTDISVYVDGETGIAYFRVPSRCTQFFFTEIHYGTPSTYIDKRADFDGTVWTFSTI